MKIKDEKGILWFLNKKKPRLPVTGNDSSQCEKRERMREGQVQLPALFTRLAKFWHSKIRTTGSDEDSQSVSEGGHDPPSSEPESPSSSSGPVGPDDISQ